MTQNCESFTTIQNIIEQDATKDKFQPENKCANGVFVYNLLYDYLMLKDGQLTALKKIENMDIRWTEGFLLLHALN